ncbi:MAG: DUF1275 domain-containing protein [Acidobacteriota bacterium]|nr:DUF1275 domain-containing protein [Acidobacteriota bacterium]
MRIPLLVAAVLTWTAGFVDAVGFISLGHIYTANMSGNTVAIGVQWVSRNGYEAFVRLWPVILYTLGLLFTRLLIEFCARKKIRTVASLAFAVEIALLTPVCLGTAPRAGVSFPLIALLALAMGIQNGALTHFSSLTLHTGFVTGTLVKIAEQGAKYLTWTFDHLRGRRTSVMQALFNSLHQRSFQVSAWLAIIWAAYVAGACCGAFADFRFSLRSLLLAVLPLLVLIALDMRRPMGLIEERDQAKLSS